MNTNLKNLNYINKKIKKYIYLISPDRINNQFYNLLNQILKTKKVSFFQLRLKNYSLKKKTLIGMKVKKINQIGASKVFSWIQDQHWIVLVLLLIVPKYGSIVIFKQLFILINI